MRPPVNLCQRGFTLVETILVVGVGTVVLMALWSMFWTVQRDTVSAERRLQAVSELQILSQFLERDLSRMAPVDDQRSVVVDRGLRLDVNVAKVAWSKAPLEARLSFVTVSYELDRRTHRVTRTFRGAGDPVGQIRLADLRFHLTNGPLRLLDQANVPGTEMPPGPTPDCLLVQALWVPHEDLAANRPTAQHDSVNLSLAFGLAHLSDRSRYPGWVTNSTSKGTLED